MIGWLSQSWQDKTPTQGSEFPLLVAARLALTRTSVTVLQDADCQSWRAGISTQDFFHWDFLIGKVQGRESLAGPHGRDVLIAVGGRLAVDLDLTIPEDDEPHFRDPSPGVEA